MTNTRIARQFFFARAFAIVNAFFWGGWFMTWTESGILLIVRQIWCVTCGVAIPIMLEIFVFIRRLEVATAIDSMTRAQESLAGAMQTMVVKLEGGHPPRNVNPECWRN